MEDPTKLGLPYFHTPTPPHYAILRPLHRPRSDLRIARLFAQRPLDSAQQVLLVIGVVPDVDSMSECSVEDLPFTGGLAPGQKVVPGLIGFGAAVIRILVHG